MHSRMNRSPSSDGRVVESADGARARPNGKPWVSPTLDRLPRLTELTLQTSIPGACDCPGAGSVVIP
jgi:hypothetical protein